MLSVVIPTIDGREKSLERALAAFEGTTHVPYETLIIRNKDTCGIAWNEGIREAQGKYVLLAADDLEPLEGWFEAGVEWVDKGFLPCARILNGDGTLQSCGNDLFEWDTGTVCDLARIPFGSLGMVQKIYPILPIHYATDYWFSHRGRENGWPTVVVRDFLFYHHFAKEGRLDERLMKDMNIYWRRAGLPGEPRPATQA